MDSVFLKLVAGSRISNYLGLRMDAGKEFSNGKNYLFLDIPFSASSSTEVKRGQHIFLESAATINVKGRDIVGVEPSLALAEFGQVQGFFHIHPDSGEQRLGFWFTAHKNIDIGTLGYAVRIYMYG